MAHNYSTLEVDNTTNLPEVRHTADRNQLPETVNTTGREIVLVPAYANGKSAGGTICGLRRRTFWTILAALAFIVGVAVGAGAGVGATRKKSSGSTPSSSSQPPPPSSGSSDAEGGFSDMVAGIAPGSKIAANNYTDASGAQHSQVYYQNSSLQIWMGDWDSLANSWSFNEVRARNNDSAVTAKNGTAIAASNYWTDAGDNTTDFRCLFVGDDNYVRFLWAPNRTGDDGWQLSDAQDRVMDAGAAANLAEYVPGCNKTEGCNSADFTVYQGGAGSLMIYYPFPNGDDGPTSGKLSIDGVAAEQGTALAVAPIPRVDKRDTDYPRVAIYFVDDQGHLAETFGGYNLSWKNNDLGRALEATVDRGGQLAAMSERRLDDFNVQVLVTKADGGVMMAYMNGDSWTRLDSVDTMENVVPLSPIAANQLGRVYAFEKGDDGTHLVEWSRVTGETPSFERVGVVEGA